PSSNTITPNDGTVTWAVVAAGRSAATGTTATGSSVGSSSAPTASVVTPTIGKGSRAASPSDDSENSSGSPSGSAGTAAAPLAPPGTGIAIVPASRGAGGIVAARPVIVDVPAVIRRSPTGGSTARSHPPGTTPASRLAGLAPGGSAPSGAIRTVVVSAGSTRSNHVIESAPDRRCAPLSPLDGSTVAAIRPRNSNTQPSSPAATTPKSETAAPPVTSSASRCATALPAGDPAAAASRTASTSGVAASPSA